MIEGFDDIPKEPAFELEKMAEKSEEDKEKIVERAIMTKARQLFDYPLPCDGFHRMPDDVEEHELIVQKISFLREKDENGKCLLAYVRQYIKRGDELELILDSQLIEFTQSESSLPIVLSHDQFPEAEMDVEGVTAKIDSLIERHLAELVQPVQTQRTDARLF